MKQPIVLFFYLLASLIGYGCKSTHRNLFPQPSKDGLEKGELKELLVEHSSMGGNTRFAEMRARYLSLAVELRNVNRARRNQISERKAERDHLRKTQQSLLRRVSALQKSEQKTQTADQIRRVAKDLRQQAAKAEARRHRAQRVSLQNARKRRIRLLEKEIVERSRTLPKEKRSELEKKLAGVSTLSDEKRLLELLRLRFQLDHERGSKSSDN